jgi:hypothetical protein
VRTSTKGLPSQSRNDRAPPRTSPAKPDIKHVRQGAHGPEPYNKYTRQGAQDGGPDDYLCNYLDNHGVKPEKVLKRDGLADADWDDPAFVNALYVASAKFWTRKMKFLFRNGDLTLALAGW